MGCLSKRVERLERRAQGQQAGRLWTAIIEKLPGMTDEDVEREKERIKAEWRTEGWQDGDRTLFVIIDKTAQWPEELGT